MALSWFFEDEASGYTDAVLESFRNGVAIVPSLWPLEVANALSIGERRGRCREAEVLRFAELLTALPIHIDEETPRRALSGSLQVAWEYHHSSHDAAYLEPAMRLDLPLATIGRKLRRAAVSAGVAIHCPETVSKQE